MTLATYLLLTMQEEEACDEGLNKRRSDGGHTEG